MGDPSISSIIIESDLVDYLRDKLDPRSLRADNPFTERLAAATIGDDEKAPEFDASKRAKDRTIERQELYDAFLAVYWGKYGSTPHAQRVAKNATDLVFKEMERTPGLQDGTVNNQEEADKFFNTISGRDVHTRAGGLIVEYSKGAKRKMVRDDQRHLTLVVPQGDSRPGEVKKVNHIEVTLYRPDRDCSAFEEANRRFDVDRQLDGVALSYGFDYPGDPSWQPTNGQRPEDNPTRGRYLMTYVDYLGSWPYATRGRVSGNGNNCHFEAHRVNPDFVPVVYKSEPGTRAFEERKKIRKAEVSLESDIIDEVDSVTYSSVAWRYNGIGVLVYTNNSGNTAAYTPIGAVIEGVIGAALHVADDPRKGGGFAIPTWKQELGDAPDKTVVINPRVKSQS